ncbi:MAG TPA: hypothetical protein VIK61_02125, partial [Acidimicrobiia bacterium]
MRFSEMMGSGGGPASKSRTRSETDAGTADTAVAEALSPYLDAATVASEPVATVAAEMPGATPGTTEPVVPAAASLAPISAPLDVAIPLDPAPARRAWPVERPLPAAPPVE